MSFHDEATETEFLARNRIAPDKWTAADIAWPVLQDIGRRYVARAPELEVAANSYARILQRCPSVHSVRWRLKDPEHLLEKIVRKRAKKEPKYLAITSENYLSLVTDLIGLRALHLFKSNWPEIHQHLNDSWHFFEKPTAFIRSGDETPEIQAMFHAADCDIKVHEAAYRSVHYVLKSTPQKQEVLAEVQVRTIFEEGWSEVDHHVRYPNFSDNQLLGMFLSLFNRIAGTADEMGNFVQTLAAAIEDYDEEVDAATKAKEAHLARIEALLCDLQDEKQKSTEATAALSKLQTEVASLRKPPAPVAAKPRLAQPASTAPSLAAMLAAFSKPVIPQGSALAEALKAANQPISKDLNFINQNAILLSKIGASAAANQISPPTIDIPKKPK